MRRSMPAMMATALMVLPLPEFTMLLITNAITAKGITSQFNQPSMGIKPTSISSRETKPKRDPMKRIGHKFIGKFNV